MCDFSLVSAESLLITVSMRSESSRQTWPHTGMGMETRWGSETRGTDGGPIVEGHTQMRTQMAAECGSESFCVSLGTDPDEVSFSRRVSVSSSR